MSERRFPMRGGPSIPWSLAEVIYAGYVTFYNSKQSIERFAERGGFGWCEVEMIYKDSRAKAAMDACIAQIESAPAGKTP